MKEFDKEFGKFWETIPPEIQAYLKKCFEETTTEEEFLSAILVGDCPECGSKRTIDCTDIEGVDDPTLGLCKDCGYFWCIECGSRLISSFNCGHWEVCDKCNEKKDEFGACGVMAWECERIDEWLMKDSSVESGNTCAWCKKNIPEDVEVFGISAKVRKGVDIKGKEGKIIPLHLATKKKDVQAVVVTKNSPAKKEGYDLVFLSCSQKCAKSLKTALSAEVKLFGDVR